MTTSTTEENGKVQATDPVEDLKAKKKARVGARSAHVAPKKAKSARKASLAKKAPQRTSSVMPTLAITEREVVAARFYAASRQEYR